MSFVTFNKRINLELLLYLLPIFSRNKQTFMFQSSKMVFIHSQIQTVSVKISS